MAYATSLEHFMRQEVRNFDMCEHEHLNVLKICLDLPNSARAPLPQKLHNLGPGTSSQFGTWDLRLRVLERVCTCANLALTLLNADSLIGLFKL